MKSAVITGSEVEAMDDRSLRELLCYCQEIVFARLNPCQKRKVVRCLQAEGSVVAITGESVEDVPTMLQADIGKILLHVKFLLDILKSVLHRKTILQSKPNPILVYEENICV